MKHRWWGALVVTGAIIVAGCGGSSDSSAPSAGTTGAPAVTSTKPGGADVTPTKLDEVVLAPTDLGPGWTVGKTATPKTTVAPTGPTTTALGAEICDGIRMPTALNAITGPEVVQVTLSLPSGTFVTESVGVLPTDAAAAIAQTRDVFEKCNGKVRTNPLAPKAGTSTFETLTLTLGQDSASSRATNSTPTLDLATTLVIGRRGSVIVSLVISSTSKPHEAAGFTDADLAKVVDAASAKLAQAS